MGVDRWSGGGKVEKLPDSCRSCRDLHKQQMTFSSTKNLQLVRGFSFDGFSTRDSKELYRNYRHWPMINVGRAPWSSRGGSIKVLD